MRNKGDKTRRLLLAAWLLTLVATADAAVPESPRRAGISGTERTDSPDGGVRIPRRERATADSVARTGALLRVEKPFHDFGTVARDGGDLVHVFRFVNEGDTPLVVVRVVTSCSCLKAFFPKRPIPAGGEGAIRIVYEPHKSEPGTFHKVVHIYSNSADGRHIVTVQGCAPEEERPNDER